LSIDNNGSSKSSLPNSSWVDYGIDWKGTTRTAGSLDPSALPLLVPTSLEVPSVAAGVSLGASGFGSFDVPGMSVFGMLAVEFSINPITGDSGAD
jgi:hypothetical protein